MPDAGPTPQAPTDSGTTRPLPQIGSYRLITQLGSGGMSSVFRAIHTDSGLEVAVKVLPRALAKNPTMLQRFLREAKSAEALEDPHIVSIYDRGSEDGRYYLVLEYVSGGDLHDRVRSKGPLGVAEAVAILKSVCLGLRHAASRGLIHRDIKPANLLLDAQGRVKITDLGLAIQLEDEDERVTRDGTTVGTVDYMAPEQARDSHATSIKSDIYSLGCTCYFLLTGKPPFTGGDVAEKLRKHALKAAPDVREERPEVPEPVAKLVMRMMAKKPEDRYSDYDALIAALDALPLDQSPPADGEPLYALIDDDDGEMDFAVEPSPSSPTVGELARPPSRAPERPSAGPRPPSKVLPAPTPAPVKAGGEFNMFDLASLDDDEPKPAKKPKAASSTVPSPAAEVTPARPGPTPRRPKPKPEPAPVALVAEEDDEEADAGGLKGGPPRPTVNDTSVKTYIQRGLLVGVAFALVAVGIQQAISLSRPADKGAEEGGTSVADGGGKEPPPPALEDMPIMPRVAPRPSGEAAAAVGIASAKGPGEVPPMAAVGGWAEPADGPPRQVDEPPAGPSWDALTRTEWSARAITDRVDGPKQVVRRLAAGPGVVDDLTKAFNVREGVVEVADGGPLFEHDLRITGQSRIIRARPGIRPLVVIEPPTLEFAKDKLATFQLEGAQLTLVGLDIVLRTDEFPRKHLALFALTQGSELSVVDCTVTVIGSRPFGLVQVGEPSGAASTRPSRVKLVRSLARGASLLGFLWAGDPGEVSLDRSVVLAGGGSAFGLSGKPSGPRRIGIVRSVVASKGPLIEVAVAGSSPPVARVVGSTLARLAGPPSSLIQVKDEAPISPPQGVGWGGADNMVMGYDGWLAQGASRVVRVRGVFDAQAAWAGSEVGTRELPAPWPAGLLVDLATPARLLEYAPDAAPTFDRVAVPPPHFWEKAYGAFARQVVAYAPPPPAAATSAASKKAEPPKPTNTRAAAEALRGKFAGRDGDEAPSAAPSDPGPAASGTVELTFDAQDARLNGDLGLFLAESIKPESRRYRIRAKGSGPHFMTPYRAPDGVAIEIIGESKPNAPGLAWWPREGAEGRALFDLRGGELTLVDVWLARTAAATPRHLVRVEDGLLTLRGCRLTAPMVVEPGGGGLIGFKANGTGPLPSNAEGVPPADRPACRLVETLLVSGAATLEVAAARGVVSLEQCALASGTVGVSLSPLPTRRDRFEADLWLDRCTVAAASAFLQVGPWPGLAPGPERPWLISSTKSVFIDDWDRPGGRQSTVLRVLDEGFYQGLVLWQAAGDAYDVGHFAAAGDGPPLALAGGVDVRRQWVELWGKSHVTGVTGPGKSGPGPGVRLVIGKLKPAKVEPGDLALDPKERRGSEIGADYRRLRLVPSAKGAPSSRGPTPGAAPSASRLDPG